MIGLCTRRALSFGVFRRFSLALVLLSFSLISTLSTGCVSHVQLPTAPTKHASLAERQAFYEEHAPLSIRQSTGTTGQMATYSGPLSYVILQNGTRVEAAADLLPLVDFESPTGRAALLAEEAQVASVWSSVGMFGMLSVGTGLMLSSLIPPVIGVVAGSPELDDGLMMASLGMMGGGALLALSSLVLLPFVSVFSQNAVRENDTALVTLDMSLRARLGLPKKRNERISQVPVLLDDDGEFE